MLAQRYRVNIVIPDGIAYQNLKQYPAAMAKEAQPKLRTITLGLEPDLIADLDEVAAAESRSRVRQAAVFLRQAIREWRRSRGDADPLARHLTPSTAREIAARHKDDAA